MARPVKTSPPQQEITPEQSALIASDIAQSDEMAVHLAEVDAAYGGGLPYNQERVIHEFHIHVGNASNSLIEAGKCVILIREHEPRGEFDRLVEERLGMSRRSAYKFMAATRRLLQLDPKTVQPVARIGQTKLLELMVDADNDDLEELANGGEFAGMTLDDIECMTKRELQAALREARENEQAMGKVMQEKNAKLDELAAKLEKPKKKAGPLHAVNWPEQIDGLKDDLHALGKVMDEVLSKHLTLIEATDVVFQGMDEGDPAQEQYKGVVFRIGEQIERLCTLAAGLRSQYQFTLSGYVELDKSHILPEGEE